MAITVNNFQSGGLDDSTSITLSAYNVGAGTAGERVLCVFLQSEDQPNGAGATSIEWGGAGGTALTKAAEVAETQNRGEIWYLNDSGIGSGSQTEDILVTLNAQSSDIGAAAVWLDGASQSGPEQSVTNSNPGSSQTAIAATINGVLAGSVVLNTMGIGDNRSMTPDGAQTKEGQQVQSSSALAVASEIPGSGNHTQGWTFSGSRRPNMILVEWAEAVSGFQAAWANNSNILIQGGGV